MDFFEVTSRRKSSRKFLPEQIKPEELDAIIRAGKTAPIGSNEYKNLHLTVVQNEEVLKALAEGAIVRRKVNRKEMEELSSSISDAASVLDQKAAYDPFYHAPTVIFISHRKQTLQPGIEYTNVSTIATTMHLAATALGLGSCFMWYALESMRNLPEYDKTELLELPEDFEPLLGLAIGYIDKELPVRELKEDKISMNVIA